MSNGPALGSDQTNGLKRPAVARLLRATSRLKGPIAAVAALGAILSGLVGYWNTYRTVRDEVAAPAVITSSPGRSQSVLPTDAGPLSIVVLPFGSVNNDAAQVLADGLTASVTSDLSRIRDVYIVSATTAQTLKNKPMTASQIGSELGVRFVLQGNVQSAGTRLRITAQLSDAAANAQIWSETFDGDTTDLFALQDKVTTLIGNSMGHELTVRAARESEKRRDSAGMTDLILRTRALTLRPQTLDNWRAIEAMWRRVLAIDPTNVEAHVFLAQCLGLELYNFNFPADNDARSQKLEEMSDLIAWATKTDPDNPDIPFVESVLLDMKRDADGSLRAAERGVELKPKWPRSYNNLGLMYFQRMDPRRATEYYLKGLALDPKHPPEVLFGNLAEAAFMLGDLDAAIEWGARSKSANTSYTVGPPTMAAAYALKGQMSEARDTVAQVLATRPEYSISWEAARHRANNIGNDRYLAWFQEKMIPALRLAGFPE